MALFRVGRAKGMIDLNGAGAGQHPAMFRVAKDVEDIIAAQLPIPLLVGVRAVCYRVVKAIDVANDNAHIGCGEVELTKIAGNAGSISGGEAIDQVGGKPIEVGKVMPLVSTRDEDTDPFWTPDP